MKFSALNVDFNGLSRDLLRSRKPVHEGIKERYPLKVVIWLLLATLPWKRLQIGMDVLPISTSPSDELFSRINIDDFERPCKIRGFIVFLQFSAAPCTSRVNCNEMAGDRLRQLANGNCYRLSRVSWALAQISCTKQSKCKGLLWFGHFASTDIKGLVHFQCAASSVRFSLVLCWLIFWFSC